MSLAIDHAVQTEWLPEHAEEHAIDISVHSRRTAAAPMKAAMAEQVGHRTSHDALFVGPISNGRSDLPLPNSLLKLLAGRPRTRVGAMRYRLAKRSIDTVLSAALLIVTSPVMVAVALLVRSTSRGPTFYRQVRWGLDGRTFTIIKFRSMVCDADQRVDEMAALAKVTAMTTTDGPAFKSPEDPRVTRIGRILRRTNLDELPQLFNVLVGHMSFVGPRPLVEKEVRRLPPEAAAQRHSVRPGLTCLWQVVRSDEMTFSERMRLDLAYVANASGTLDAAVMSMTPHAVAVGNGSY